MCCANSPLAAGRGVCFMQAVARSRLLRHLFRLQDIDGRDLQLSKYKGKVVLVVNVASACGFTPQYTELAELYNKYKSKGLVVLGAPCNQFGSQVGARNVRTAHCGTPPKDSAACTATLPCNTAPGALRGRRRSARRNECRWPWRASCGDARGRCSHSPPTLHT